MLCAFMTSTFFNFNSQHFFEITDIYVAFCGFIGALSFHSSLFTSDDPPYRLWSCQWPEILTYVLKLAGQQWPLFFVPWSGNYVRQKATQSWASSL
jgi:hypothetical protein